MPPDRDAVCLACGGLLAPVLARLGCVRCVTCRVGDEPVRAELVAKLFAPPYDARASSSISAV